MNIVAILRQARAWALYLVKGSSDNIVVHMDIGRVKDADHRAFLAEPPRWFGDWASAIPQMWWSTRDGDSILFDRGHDAALPETHLHLRVIEDEHAAYACLYDDQDRIYSVPPHDCPTCLIFWDKHTCDATNPGYARGRCPDVVDPLMT